MLVGILYDLQSSYIVAFLTRRYNLLEFFFSSDYLPKNFTNEKIFDAVLPEKLQYHTPDTPELERNTTTLIKKLYFGNDLVNNFNSDTATQVNYMRVRLNESPLSPYPACFKYAKLLYIFNYSSC